MKIPKAIEKVIEGFERLPGVGPKSAQRLAFYLLHVPQSEIDEFANNIKVLKEHIKICENCFNIGNDDICEICKDFQRDNDVLCVVEDALDVIAFERGGKYKGQYHVLHGIIDPLNSIGPDDIYIPQLISRVKKDSNVKEIIIATNPTMEGEATAMYILRQLQDLETKLKVTRIGRGLPSGADIEYADELTLNRALEGRAEY